MLEDIDKTDWASLNHAYGTATDVPDDLRNLLSQDPRVREDALSNLCGTIWHQGTVYPATVPAIPLLHAMLVAGNTPDKPLVAGLLAACASGQGYYLVHAPGKEDISSAILEESGTTLEKELESERELLRQVRAAASPSIPLLVPYLRDEEDELRYQVANALGYYPEHRARSLPELRRALQTEPEEHVQEMLAASIAQLEETEPA